MTSCVAILSFVFEIHSAQYNFIVSYVFRKHLSTMPFLNFNVYCDINLDSTLTMFRNVHKKLLWN